MLLWLAYPQRIYREDAHTPFFYDLFEHEVFEFHHTQAIRL